MQREAAGGVKRSFETCLPATGDEKTISMTQPCMPSPEILDSTERHEADCERQVGQEGNIIPSSATNL